MDFSELSNCKLEIANILNNLLDRSDIVLVSIEPMIWNVNKQPTITFKTLIIRIVFICDFECAFVRSFTINLLKNI